ncbi:HD domain-containing phosphohydrolase [Maridesulfovibrio salexigens]|uniref:Metal dependent phosphohydrolase n=1 Tax=Maridesulfovibrio salexigens (strain ATCC 14822 / DSM 2638 / NCIMB 8403 / VKM B-1763) TaxID=526222 RepID=C6BXE0_MARSD|nr:HD domain-containing phosphohydrolase [Maridesulfovibrio salexigens]ACS80446.1 metal dependent phosphohydrolase [Maridesulfovibrio salexigens DSM 2638]
MERKWSIASLICCLLVGTCLLTTGTILFIVKSQSDQAAIESAEEYFEEITDKTAAKLDAFIEPVVALANVAGETLCMEASAIKEAAYSNKFKALKIMLDSNNQLMSAYLGYEDGSFYQVIAPRGIENIITKYEAPEGCAYIERLLLVDDGDGQVQRWRYFDSSQHLLGERFDTSSYDPRERSWYRQALLSCGTIFTSPYVFSSSGMPGITCARTLGDGTGVFGLDISLNQLGSMLAKQNVSDNGLLWIVDNDNRMVAYPNKDWAVMGSNLQLPMAVSYPDNTVKCVARHIPIPEDSRTCCSFFEGSDGQDYMASLTPIYENSGLQLVVAAAAPVSDVTGHISRMSTRIMYSSAILLLLLSFASVYIARRGTRVMSVLLREAKKVQSFDFSESPPLNSRIKELDTLGKAGLLMKETIRDKTANLITTQGKLEKLVSCGLALSSEKELERLVSLIFDSARDLVEADGGVIYLMEGNKLAAELLSLDSSSIVLGGLSENPVPRVMVIPEIIDFVSKDSVLWYACEAYNKREVFSVKGVELSLFPTGLEHEPERGHIHSMITAPIITRSDEILGVIQLFNSREGGLFEDGLDDLLGSLVAQAAVALDNRNLVNSLEELFNAFIKVIAASIDAKSPYTGGHCTRVPVLAEMLTKAVHETESGPLKDFRVETDEEWRELWVAGWLHDCGKVTTPEYVVDKATKLETIYDRIHEVRMRFEVLRRDAEIEYYRKLANGGNQAELKQELDVGIKQLEDDFSFLAECNIGGEFMSDERKERLAEIGKRKWLRYFDKRLGVGHFELERMRDSGVELPVWEKLLMDKPEHIIPRTSNYAHIRDACGNPIDVPENEYNRGELYNLMISRGTLTDEERFKINAHMLSGLDMLSQIPFPKHLERVTEIATGHHETLIGTGYPLKKDISSLSVETRILAIADIFEALTASDRPYKKAKKLSEALKIMTFMRSDQHIDGDVMDVFLRKNVFMEYAEKFLAPEQCDVEDATPYLSKEK